MKKFFYILFFFLKGTSFAGNLIIANSTQTFNVIAAYLAFEDKIFQKKHLSESLIFQNHAIKENIDHSQGWCNGYSLMWLINSCLFQNKKFCEFKKIIEKISKNYESIVRSLIAEKKPSKKLIKTLVLSPKKSQLFHEMLSKTRLLSEFQEVSAENGVFAELKNSLYQGLKNSKKREDKTIESLYREVSDALKNHQLTSRLAVNFVIPTHQEQNQNYKNYLKWEEKNNFCTFSKTFLNTHISQDTTFSSNILDIFHKFISREGFLLSKQGYLLENSNYSDYRDSFSFTSDRYSLLDCDLFISPISLNFTNAKFTPEDLKQHLEDAFSDTGKIFINFFSIHKIDEKKTTSHATAIYRNDLGEIWRYDPNEESPKSFENIDQLVEEIKKLKTDYYGGSRIYDTKALGYSLKDFETLNVQKRDESEVDYPKLSAIFKDLNPGEMFDCFLLHHSLTFRVMRHTENRYAFKIGVVDSFSGILTNYLYTIYVKSFREFLTKLKTQWDTTCTHHSVLKTKISKAECDFYYAKDAPCYVLSSKYHYSDQKSFIFSHRGNLPVYQNLTET
ncbi:hypothetical protein P618_201001 [Holospora obtusa F1]|uniref:Peptidase C58 YopT-type domain-containing protein n=1 Tax=Holospora obtusa F1 TaxID=1399147 RepID=W6TSR5_HOLOB|nr:hypothetical protein [Holospora obtusa]ETZ06812.1 hypothetical protein P618_201001 [Holospora obtusa F1]